MTCFTEPCFLTSLLDALQNGAALLDYAGTLLLGDDWCALTPRLEAHAEAASRLLSGLFGDVPAPCGGDLSGAERNA